MISIDISLLFTMLNLVIFYLLMKKFLFNPIKKIMQERDEEIKKEYREAAQKNREADELRRRYQASLDNAGKEGEQIIKESRGRANAEYSRIVEEADKKAEEIVDKAKRYAEAQYRRTIDKAEHEIANLAIEAAERVAVQGRGETGRNLYDIFLEKANAPERND